MAILNNLENAWDEEFSFEYSSASVRIFAETCCNGCFCQSEKDHEKE